jgi:tetratricopeptide (TPR) repeat protein
MKGKIILILLLSVLSACSTEQTTTPTKTTTTTTSPAQGSPDQNAENEIQQGARVFKAGDFAGARQHFEKALALDPTNKKAAILLARVIHTQHRREDKTAANTATADEALNAYQKALAINPESDEALKNIIALYKVLGRDDELRRWVGERAANTNLTPKRRAELYGFLASKDFDCSLDVTIANEQSITRPDGSMTTRYQKPADARLYEKATGCVAAGLESIETAIKLDPESERLWGTKFGLLSEARKLALMDGKTEKAEELARQADEVRKRATELLNIKKKKAEDIREPSPDETMLDSLVPPVPDETHLIAPVEPESGTSPNKKPE